MGVTGLWPVLNDLCERKPLTYLSGKKVSVDLSGWVVEATLAKGLNKSKNPHLRNLFFRVSSLLRQGVHPIFVMEGKPPLIKEIAFKKRNFTKGNENNSESDISRKKFDETLKQVVDGVITEDSDAFLYGADEVYRDFSSHSNDSHVNVYSLKSNKDNKHQLNRNKLVALALLLGCDYSEGVPSVGRETALKLFSELNCNDVLQRFIDWKNLSESELFPGLDSNCIKREAHCSRCGHLGSSPKHMKEGCLTCDSQFTCYLSDPSKPCKCSWHVNEKLMEKWKTEWKVYNVVKNCPDFPNMEVINEYLNYTDNIPCDESIDWNCPHIMNFQERAFNYLGWTFESSFEKIFPLITSWQLFKLTDKCGDEMNFIFEPIKVVKERNRQGVRYLEVQWKVLDDYSDAVPTDNLTTLEDKDRFSACYKEIVEEYYKLKSDLKEQKQSKSKGKKLKSNEGNRKIPEFFVQKTPFKRKSTVKNGSMESEKAKRQKQAPS